MPFLSISAPLSIDRFHLTTQNDDRIREGPRQMRTDESHESWWYLGRHHGLLRQLGQNFRPGNHNLFTVLAIVMRCVVLQDTDIRIQHWNGNVAIFLTKIITGCIARFQVWPVKISSKWWHFRFSEVSNGPLTRYVKLRVAHAPGMPGTFSPATDFKGNR